MCLYRLEWFHLKLGGRWFSEVHGLQPSGGLQGDDGEGSDDAVLGELVQLQVVEGLPGADDGDVCA